MTPLAHAMPLPSTQESSLSERILLKKSDKYIRAIVQSDGFKIDPRTYMVNLMIERGESASGRIGDWQRGFVVANIDYMKMISFEFLKSFAEEYFSKNSKDSIHAMTCFEKSLKNEDFLELLEKAREDFEDNHLSFGEHNLRKAFVIFSRSAELMDFEISQSAYCE